MSTAGPNVWINVTRPSFPSIALSTRVFNFTKYPVTEHPEEQVVQLANELHDQTGSTSTKLSLDRGAL